MDMIERRIRDAVATVLSRGAKALEQTATELERAAGELRNNREGGHEGPDSVWSEPSTGQADTITRSAPLRAVPDSPSDSADGAATPTDGPHVPPVRPPQIPDRPRRGTVDAEVATDAGASDPGAAPPDPLRQLATGTVSEIRTRLGDLTDGELRRLRDIEVHNRNRTTLLAAIDQALDADE